MEDLINLLEKVAPDQDQLNRHQDNIHRIYSVLGNKAIMDLESVFKLAHEKIKRLEESVDEMAKYHPLGPD